MKTLIVDDNHQDRRLLRYYMERQGGEVIEAQDGEAAFKLAQEHHPTLIISDALMPKVDGFQLLRQVRKDPELYTTPFIFYSSVYTGSSDQKLALSLGADAFLVKPKEADEFWKEINSVLEGCQLKGGRTASATIDDDKEFLEKYSQLVAYKLDEKVQQLQKSEERYRSMVEISPDWIWEVDPDGLFTYVSPKIYELLGYEPEEVLGQTPFSLMAEEEQERMSQLFAAISAARDPFYGLINTNLHKDGTRVILETSGVPLFDEKGLFFGYRGIDRNVTARVKLDKEKRQLQAHFQSTFENSPISMCLLDHQGHIMKVNRTLCDTLGYQSEAIIKADWPNLTHPDDLALSKAAMAPVLAGETDQYTLEKRYIHKQGHTLWGRVNCSVVRNQAGEIDFFIATVEDITEGKRAKEELSESERRFRGIFEQMAVGTLLADPSGRFILTNEKMCDIVGYSHDELLEKTFLDLTHPDDLPKNKDIVHRMLDGTLKSVSFEKRYIRKEGSLVWVNVTSSVVFKENDEPEYFVAVVEDIHQRKDMEQALELTQSCVDEATDAIFWMEVDGRYRYVNHAACQSLGYTQTELLQMKIFEITSTHTPATWPDFLQSVNAEGHYRFEGIHRHKNGAEFPVDVMVSHMQQGETELLHAYVRDISESNKQQHELESAIEVATMARNELDAIFKSMADAVVVTDDTGCVLFINHKAERTFGRSLQELKGQSITDIVGSPQLTQHISGRSHGPTSYMDLKVEMTDHLSGERRTFEARSRHVTDKGQTRHKHVTIFRDITRERESDRLKSEFIATAAHELRTPLTAIHGFAELIYDDRELLSAHHQEYLEDIIERSDVLERRIDQLLNLSRMETGRPMVIEAEMTDLCRLVRDTLKEYLGSSDAARVQLDLPSEPVWLTIDGALIVQVVENLLTNAFKYSPEGSPIFVHVEQEPDVVNVCVQDHGIGMSPDVIAHIFDKFYRADSSDTAVRGLGLGMSIAKMIINQHNGRIWVDSQKDQGTRACFSLPCS